ncbi:MAG: hypothetical protein Q9167_007891 [Letrouitia subvulpina]
MTRKRKRRQPASDASQPRKRIKRESNEPAPAKELNHPTLSLYYPCILTLRDHLLSKLPITSKKRRRKVQAIRDSSTACPKPAEAGAQQGDIDKGRLAKLLDNTLIYSSSSCSYPVTKPATECDFKVFSQHVEPVDETSFLEGNTSQTEIVDFAIWLLFHRVYRKDIKPTHLLCHGYRRAKASSRDGDGDRFLANIPGVTSYYPNCHVTTLKGPPWSCLVNLLGKECEEIMLDLILNHGIFVAVDAGKNNYYQLCGTPITELKPMQSKSSPPKVESLTDITASRQTTTQATSKQPLKIKPSSSITLVRNRMFYARPALNAHGKVSFGLRHIHALNRFANPENAQQTQLIMMYIFPRQFKLHNVFTSVVDPQETVQPFKDYTLRENEIAEKQRLQNSKSSTKGDSTEKLPVPRRLRGTATELVKKMQKLHARCSYSELLRHYCPTTGYRDPSVKLMSRSKDSMASSELKSQLTSTTKSTQYLQEMGENMTKGELVDSATPSSNVSAFCRAVLSKLIPDGFWGHGPDGVENKKVVMLNVHQFVQMRRYETLNLHEIYQGIKIKHITWLVPPHVQPSTNMSNSDMQKRKELFLEFLYYIFDSLLIPLIRSNFHVTESNLHKNRIFYFRHDVWKTITEPPMSLLKLSMFEEVDVIKARQLLDARSLGFSQMRLLPKGKAVRPITNLRRRVTKLRDGKAVLGRSINSVMAPVFNMLDYEKRMQPNRVGSALFSAGDLYPRLKSFKQNIVSAKGGIPTFYFAKADVQSCFDTIPQDQVVKLMKQLASKDEYQIFNHAEIKPSDVHGYRVGGTSQLRPARKFIASARAPLDFQTFDEAVNTSLANRKKNTIFVDKVVPSFHQKEKLLSLLEDHVERNIIKIGKKFFKQKKGIPQGSVLSSLLCNYFYADLEHEELSFLNCEESLLLRLIDDFLLITTNQEHAKRFLQTMHNGVESYGVQVNPAKSLVNFASDINGTQLARLGSDMLFPYCGTMINTKTLEISKDRDRARGTGNSDQHILWPYAD